MTRGSESLLELVYEHMLFNDPQMQAEHENADGDTIMPYTMENWKACPIAKAIVDSWDSMFGDGRITRM